MNSLRFLVKTFARTVVDSCILPGTTLGTEILWLYMKQWKKELSTISLAIISIVILQLNLPADAHTVVSQALSGRGSES
jgi:hypothetical protein